MVGVPSEGQARRNKLGQITGGSPSTSRTTQKAIARKARLAREDEAGGPRLDAGGLKLVEKGTTKPTPLPLPLNTDRDPWQRQGKEPPRAYALFIVYRDLGPFDRSILKTGRAAGVGPTVPRRMSHQWRWEERAAAWDDQRQREFDANKKQAQDQAIRSHTNASRSLLMQALRLLEEQRASAKVDGRALQQAAISIDKAIFHNRLSLGLPTDISRQDQYLRQLLEEALTSQTAIMALLEEMLCDTCRGAVGTELRRISAKNRVIANKAS